MKHFFNKISNTEKNSILEMHKKAIIKESKLSGHVRINEQGINTQTTQNATSNKKLSSIDRQKLMNISALSGNKTTPYTFGAKQQYTNISPQQLQNIFSVFLPQMLLAKYDAMQNYVSKDVKYDNVDYLKISNTNQLASLLPNNPATAKSQEQATELNVPYINYTAFLKFWDNTELMNKYNEYVSNVTKNIA